MSSSSDKGDLPLPLIKPRIGGRGGEVRGDRAPTFRQSVLQKLQRLTGGGGIKGGLKGRRGRLIAPHVRSPSALSRRCLVKGRYIRMDARGCKAARRHLAYIERDGVERDGSKGRLFDAGGDLDREAFGMEIEGEARQFRFIVSPEDGDEIDLREFTRNLMQQMEKDLGHKFIWAAVAHYNTDNPHAHLVVRGVDREGRSVYIPEQYMAHGMRNRAMELATRDLGPRTEIDMRRQLTREVSQERPTAIDRRLGELLTPDRTLDMAAVASSSQISRPHALARLQKLEELAVVERTSPATWRFVDAWQDRLRGMGERGDIIKRIHQAMKGVAPATSRSFDPATAEKAVEGVLRRKGLHDELAGDFYGIVETGRGEAYHVRLDDASADELAEGELVRVEAGVDRWVKETDRVIERVAALTGGVYDPVSHERQLARAPVRIGGREIPAPEVVQVNLRRLQRLEKYKLVTRLADGRWRIPGDLVKQLEARERQFSAPRAQVRRIAAGLDDQVGYRGRTWLDDVSGHPAAHAPHGFGAEVRRALDRRAGALKALGIDASSPARFKLLDELERCEVGERVAAERGLTFVPHARRLRGQVRNLPVSSSGVAYVAVLDEAGHRVAVIQAPSNAGSLEGRQVEITSERDGRFALRQIEIDRGI